MNDMIQLNRIRRRHRLFGLCQDWSGTEADMMEDHIWAGSVANNTLLGMAWTRKSSGWDRKRLPGPDPFQHWYRDNQVYFITARCRDGYPAFASDAAASVFWNRFGHYTAMHTFEPWVATLMNNHYHFVGYLKVGAELRELMRKLHGSVAKLVNDVLPERRVPFWRGADGHDYFDGCLRDDEQYTRAYRYTLLQAVRAGIVRDWREYANTRFC